MAGSWLIETLARIRTAVERFVTSPQVRQAWDWAKEPLLIVAAVYKGAAALAQPFYVPSGSMQPTLGIGDLLIATKFSYGFNRFSLPFTSGPTPTKTLFASLPQAGDVVVFRKPGKTAETLVKRVVGLPGDHIQMKAGRLWVNGRELAVRPGGSGKVEDGPTERAPGSYFDADRYIETLPNGREHPIYKKPGGSWLDDTPELVVPADHLFVMGDNRDDSADSRVPTELNGVGFLPAANVVGRARVVVASVDFVNASGIWAWPFQLRLGRTLTRVR